MVKYKEPNDLTVIDEATVEEPSLQSVSSPQIRADSTLPNDQI